MCGAQQELDHEICRAVGLTDGSNANETRQRAPMGLLDWLKGRRRPLEDSRLRGQLRRAHLRRGDRAESGRRVLVYAGQPVARL